MISWTGHQVGLAAHFHEPRRRALKRTGPITACVEKVRLGSGRRDQANLMIIQCINQIYEATGFVAFLRPKLWNALDQNRVKGLRHL